MYEQDRTRWDRAMIATGKDWLERSATGSALSRYHVEAAIAAEHASAARFDATDWRQIVSLYDALMRVAPSPIVALNRAIAVAQLEGPQRGLDAIAEIGDRRRLERYPFYHAALGELEQRRGQRAIAGEHFRTAYKLARNQAERRFFEDRVAACGGGEVSVPSEVL